MCVCEYSTDAVKYSCHRPSLCLPSPPSFFHIGTFHGKKTNWPAFISRSRWTLFFFFFTFYDICCLARVCTWSVCVGCIIFEYCYHILQIFFFFREREREIVSPEGRANFHEGSCMDSLREGLDGTMRILSSAGLFNSGGPRCKWI